MQQLNEVLAVTMIQFLICCSMHSVPPLAFTAEQQLSLSDDLTSWQSIQDCWTDAKTIIV